MWTVQVPVPDTVSIFIVISSGQDFAAGDSGSGQSEEEVEEDDQEQEHRRVPPKVEV